MGVLKKVTLAFLLAGSLLASPAAAESRGKAPAGAASKPAASPQKARRKGKVAKRVVKTPPRAVKEAPAPPPASVGHPNAGHLAGGVRLDTKLPYVRVVPAYESDDMRWGLPALVRMIERSAKAVDKRFPGSKLSVGDLSLRQGGDVLGHHSHESGRDVDLGFYVLDAKGKPVLSRAFVRVDDKLDAVGSPGAKLDLARNWLLIQTMLADPRAHVSHIFVSEAVRSQLLAYAKKQRVPQRVVDRAAIAMMQPSDSIAHDDHFHVRISCPRSMKGSCIELSKNAPTSASRVASRSRSGTSRRARAAAPARAPSLSRGAPQVPMGRAAVVDLDREEAEADAAEVKEGLDDSGLAKITE